MSEEALRAIALQVRNWGRWGPDDELGTLNYITPERIAAACRLATTGKVFALGIPLDRNGPQSGTRARFNPIHTMFRDGGDAPKTPAEIRAMEGYGGSDDWIVMPLQCVTQWDSLAHIFYEGKMYNGYDAALVTSSGAAHYDLIRFPGVSVHTAPWLHARQIAAIAMTPRGGGLPVGDRGFRNFFHVSDPQHTYARRDLPEDLVADCATDGRYAFLLVAPPLPVTRAVGTPINPYALK
jgi:hypothetical protein